MSLPYSHDAFEPDIDYYRRTFYTGSIIAVKYLLDSRTQTGDAARRGTKKYLNDSHIFYLKGVSIYNFKVASKEAFPQPSVHSKKSPVHRKPEHARACICNLTAATEKKNYGHTPT